MNRSALRAGHARAVAIATAALFFVAAASARGDTPRLVKGSVPLDEAIALKLKPLRA